VKAILLVTYLRGEEKEIDVRRKKKKGIYTNDRASVNVGRVTRTKGTRLGSKGNQASAGIAKYSD